MSSNETRSSERSRVAESRRAINIELLRSEERAAEARALSASHSTSHSCTFARDSNAYRTIVIKLEFPSSSFFQVIRLLQDVLIGDPAGQTFGGRREGPN